FQCLRQRITKLAALQSLRGDFPPVCEIPWDVVPLVTLLSLLNGFVQVPAIFAELHFRFVDRNLNEPRAEFGLLAKPAQGFECLHHCFLSALFGMGIIFNDRKSRKKSGTLVRLDKFVESFLFSGLHAPYESLFEHVALPLSAPLS